jgi:glycosyltransferase involved in cell wall biosynthesis
MTSPPALPDAAAVDVRALSGAPRIEPPAPLASPLTSTPRVAIAHDWLVIHGGSERCVEEMLRAFPQADLTTTLVRPDELPERLAAARPSVLQHLPGASTHHEWLLPLMPAAWRLRRPIRDVDAVISSSHACAASVRVADGIPHLCYCHTPMRYAWDFDSEAARFPLAIRPAARALMCGFRRWDRKTAQNVTEFAVNSRAVAERVRRFYGRTARVIHPPVRTGFFTPSEGHREHFLYVGRLVSYKRPDLVVEAFADLPYRLLMVGSGHLEARLHNRATKNVRFIQSVSDEELRDLYRTARALVHPGAEDFGIAMAEAQACGTPVIAPADGGALDIVEHGRTGLLVQADDVAAFRRAIRRIADHQPDAASIRAHARRFSDTRFREEIRDAIATLIGPARG